MKAKIISFADSPENAFPGKDGNQVKATALTIDVNGQALTYITFAQKVEVGEEIEYELYNDKKGNGRLRILRTQQQDFKGGSGKSSEQWKMEILARACNQAVQLATKDNVLNTAEADRQLAWIKDQLNATQPVQKAEPQAQQPVAQTHPNAPTSNEPPPLPRTQEAAQAESDAAAGQPEDDGLNLPF